MVLGAGGMLGWDVVAGAPPSVELTALTRKDCDILQLPDLQAALRDLRPDAVINCAAYTAVDAAEGEAERALAVNGTAPGNVGRAAAAVGAAVVHLSTDYVFDGTARRPYRGDDAPRPLSVYGRSKLAGEQALRESGADHLVIRTSWLFGESGRSFPRTMWNRARAAQVTRVVNDQWGRPTYTGDLAGAIWRLLERWHPDQRRDTPCLHASNEGPPTTWLEIAQRVFTRAGRPDFVLPCTSTEYPAAARRPAYAVLDTGVFCRQVGPLPDWRDALDRFLDRLAAEAV